MQLLNILNLFWIIHVIQHHWQKKNAFTDEYTVSNNKAMHLIGNNVKMSCGIRAWLPFYQGAQCFLKTQLALSHTVDMINTFLPAGLLLACCQLDDWPFLRLRGKLNYSSWSRTETSSYHYYVPLKGSKVFCIVHFLSSLHLHWLK